MADTDAKKREMQEAIERQQRAMQEMIQNLTKNWQENPETIAEMLEFGSRIYHYSIRNNMLIYAQNPHATYVQSFKAWKDIGAAVKKGEHGYKVYVPVTATILKIDGKLVPLEHATKEQKAQYKAGEIESITKRRFKIGTVFDISQTNYPKENYPKLFEMGYESVVHGAIVNGLIEYAQNTLNCPVKSVDLHSIALRGNYSPATHSIQLNEMLEDTERLSTLSHELGHALLHQNIEIEKTMEQIEIEADALGIMLESHLGIEITEGRKRHLAENYRRYQEVYENAPTGQKPEGFGTVLANVFQTFRSEIDEINKVVERHVEKEKRVLKKQNIQTYKPIAQKQAAEEKEKIYDRIKQNISILGYAEQHGMVLKRVGRYYTLKNHDSVRIDPERNCFWRNSGVGRTNTGSVIDFATAFVHDEDLHEALKELSEMVSGEVVKMRPANVEREGKRTELKSLEENLPEKSKNMHRVYAYLTKTRFIDPDIVQEFVNRKMLYQDINGNCVFVSYDSNNKPVFANFRGTLTERKFLGDVSGSNYQQGFYIHNQADKLIVTESVIDAMSVMSILKSQGVDYKQYDYLPLSGAEKHEPLYLHLKDQPKEQVLLALDHDIAGVKNMHSISDHLLDESNEVHMKEDQITFHVSGAKDWNQELVDTMKSLQRGEQVDFLTGQALPEIYYCAVQSTLNVEERGFHRREGQNQYRLVELNKQGEIVPMDIKRNVIFKDPEEVRKLVPEMYEEVPYTRLSSMQKEIKHKEIRMPEIKDFSVEKGVVMATVIYKDEQTREAVCQEQDRYYVAVGDVAHNNYEQLDLDEEQVEVLENFISKNGLSVSNDLKVLVAEEVETLGEKKEETPSLKKDSNQFLDTLKKQQFQDQECIMRPEIAIGIGE